MLKNKLTSDSGDGGVTISQILWVGLAVLAVIVIGGLLYRTMVERGKKLAECVKNANALVGQDGSTCTWW